MWHRAANAPRAPPRMAGARCALHLPPLDAIDLPPLGYWLSALAIVATTRAVVDRPHGWLAPDADLAVRQSTVPGGGRGVFARRALPAGFVLGAYPGRLRPAADFARKLRDAPDAWEYAWQLGGGRFVLDPTGPTGELCDPVPLLPQLPQLPLLAVPSTLACINEPPAGGDVNVATEEVPRGAASASATAGRGVGDADGPARDLLMVAERDILAGEELFLDYGRTYDRSAYTPS